MSAQNKRQRIAQSVIHAQERFEGKTGQHSNILDIASPDIERTLISCVFHDPDIFPRLAELTQAGDFFILSHGFYWYAFEQVYPHIDMMTVLAELEKNPAMPTDSAVRWMEETIALAPDLRAAEAYARMVRETAVVIRVLNSTETMRETLFDKALSLEQKLDACNQAFFKASEQGAGQNPSSARHFVQSVADEIEDMRQNGGLRYIPTGFPALDKMIDGVFCSEVTVLAGSPGGGKTTMMLNMLYNRLTRKKGNPAHIALFSLEMSGQEVMRSLSSIHTRIPQRAFKKGDLTDQQWQMFVTAMQDMADWPLSIVDRNEYPALTPIQLRRRLRRLLVDTPVDMVVIDGLWLMEASDPTINRPRDISNIMRDLTEIASEYQIPILLLHQYSREGILRQSGNRPPTTFDLAEGASVERTTQSIIGLVRRKLYGSLGDAADYTEAHILKARGGGENVGECIKFEFHNGKFHEVQS